MSVKIRYLNQGFHQGVFWLSLLRYTLYFVYVTVSTRVNTLGFGRSVPTARRTTEAVALRHLFLAP